MSEPLDQTAPLLPAVTRQHSVMEYGWEGSAFITITTTSTSDIMGQHNKIGGITLGASFVFIPLSGL